MKPVSFLWQETPEPSAIKRDGRRPTVPASAYVSLAGGGILSRQLSLHPLFWREKKTGCNAQFWDTLGQEGSTWCRNEGWHSWDTFEGVFELGPPCCISLQLQSAAPKLGHSNCQLARNYNLIPVNRVRQVPQSKGQVEVRPLVVVVLNVHPNMRDV